MHRDDVVDDVGLAFSVRCGRSSVEQMIRADLEAQGFQSDPHASILLLIDAPVGFVLRHLEDDIHANRTTIVVTPNPTPDYWLTLLEFKPNVLIVGDALNQEVEQAIIRAARGEPYALTPPTTPRLTPIERKVLHLIARGWTSKRIAQHLSMKEQTVSNTLSRIYTTLGVSGRVEAAFYYYGLTELIG